MAISSRLDDIKNSLRVWVEIIGMLKDCFSALSKNKVLEKALVKLATESNKLDDAEQEGLKEMIEYCRQSRVAERKAEIVVRTFHSIVKSTLRALNYSTETGKIFEGLLKKIESKSSELRDAIVEIGKVKDSFLQVQIGLQNSQNQWESKRNQLSNDTAILKRGRYRQMASALPAIAGVIAIVPYVGPVAAISGTSAAVGLITVTVVNYMEGFGADEYRKLIDKIKKVEQFFEETQNCLETSHESIKEKLSLLMKIKSGVDDTVFGCQDVLKGIVSPDDVKEDLEVLKILCEEYLELSSSLMPRNLFKLDQRISSPRKQEMSKRKRKN